MTNYIRVQRGRKRDTKVELAPLIDVIFLLLIFFAVSSTIVLNQLGIKLTLPAAETVAKQKLGLSVIIDDKHQIYFQKERVSEAVIRKKVAEALQEEPNTQVILQAHKLTPYAMIIRVLDEVRLGGCFDIVLEAAKKTN